MRIRKSFHRAGLLALLYLWWAILSSSYLKSYFSYNLIAGADGSGHVMLVHLFANHVFPNLFGWLPEPYGGMPFPVFYPPLFYWLGALLIKVTGISASVAVKILGTSSFAALPGVLFILGRRVGLSSTEAAVASGWAGVIACGSNVASLSGLGLLGQFEVGLYTQTLGFVWLCVWCAFLPFAHRSWQAATISVFALSATILSNVHVLPFAAIYAGCWLTMTFYRAVRSRADAIARPIWPHIVTSLLWLIAPIVISGIWLVSLVRWYGYAVGQPLPTGGLFSSLGGFNVVWPACLLIAWQQRKRYPRLAALSVAIVLTATTALTPLGEIIKWIPFQPARVIAGPLVMATIPLTKLFADTLLGVVGGKRWVVNLSLALLLVPLAWIHPSQRFGIAAFSGADEKLVAQLSQAVRQLPPGKLLVEIVESNAIFNSAAPNPKELALSRTIAHHIAIEGRPILWSVFREQTLISPFSTAANNLLSTTKERFGIGGYAVEESFQNTLRVEDKLRINRHLGVRYYLVKTVPQVELLSRTSDLYKVWNIRDWFLFADTATSPSSFTSVPGKAVLAWTAARLKNRSGTEVELFNLGEAVAFAGHPEIPVLWAFTEGANVADILSRNAGTTLIVDPSVRPDTLQKLLSAMEEDSSRGLHLILLNDHSPLASFLAARREKFASFESLELDPYSNLPKTLLKDIAGHVVRLNRSNPLNVPTSPPMWQTGSAYFPAWQAQNGQVFLTGQGSMVVSTPLPPILFWDASEVQLISLAVSVLGMLLFLLSIRRCTNLGWRSRTVTPSLKKNVDSPPDLV
jgi:hypothetical protein